MSAAPYTTLLTRASWIAERHMAHGSKVVYLEKKRKERHIVLKTKTSGEIVRIY
jgi:hypothetical protein